MSKLLGHFLPVLLIMGLFLSGCNLPANVTAPGVSAEDIASTAVARVYTEQAAAAPSATLTPEAAQAPAPAAQGAAAQCNPTVTATTDANVRAGDSTEYAVIGNLPYGGTAVVAGTNAAHTWWYIVFAGGPGGYGWISGSVVTTACLPAVVQVVVAPPLPAAPPPVAVEPTATSLSIAPWIPLLRKLPTPTTIPLFQFDPDLFQQVVPLGD
jgi:uncharacterized protein YraI